MPHASAHAQSLHLDGPIRLERGGTLPAVDVAYETWGTLNDDGSNAVLVCHAISGDSHAARHGPTDRPGWWDAMIGPGRPLDTERFFVVCSNILGGCSGTTGPSSINPATGRPYGPDFPAVTLGDMVAVQTRLLDHLNIPRLHAAVGGSLGGHQVLTLATTEPQRVGTAVVVATSPRLSAQAMSFDVVARNAIHSDPNFHGGHYYDRPQGPDTGLAIARMIGHITYLSVDSMTAKFDPDRHRPRDIATAFEKRFSVGSYLAHQGQRFTERFDANSYLAITSAMDWFDLGETPQALRDNLGRSACRWGVISFSTDWLFPPAQSRQIVDALNALGRSVTYTEVTTEHGHDAFLLDPDIAQYGPLVRSLVAGPTRTAPPELSDHERHLLGWIGPGESVLDLGCGEGRLLDAVRRRRPERPPRRLGVEVARDAILAAADRGVDVIDYDLNRGLHAFPDHHFDVVVLSATLQIIENIDLLFAEMTRVGRRAILGFTNFGHRSFREQFAATGRSPRSDAGGGSYNHAWHDTPNRRFPSILDVLDYCASHGYTVQRSRFTDTTTGVAVAPDDDPNLHADHALLEIQRA